MGGNPFNKGPSKSGFLHCGNTFILSRDTFRKDPFPVRDVCRKAVPGIGGFHWWKSHSNLHCLPYPEAIRQNTLRQAAYTEYNGTFFFIIILSFQTYTWMMYSTLKTAEKRIISFILPGIMMKNRWVFNTAISNIFNIEESRWIRIFEYRKNIIYGRNSAADNHGKIRKFELIMKGNRGSTMEAIPGSLRKMELLWDLQRIFTTNCWRPTDDSYVCPGKTFI